MLNKPYTAVWNQSIAHIDRSQWNKLAIPNKNPFMEWEWFYMLEVSKSANEEKGWKPNHLTLFENNHLIAVAPLYIKTNSEGEYVYDLDWVQISKRIESSYYPKMVGMTPLTPVPGYRFLIDPDYDEMMTTRIMVNLIHQFCKQYRLSGCNFLFVDPKWVPVMILMEFAEWKHYTFQWNNSGFDSFDDYLCSFNANQRKNIRKERKALDEQNIDLKIHTGNQIQSDFYSKMSEFYQKTSFRYNPSGNRYLTSGFFHCLKDYYSHRSMFISAFSKNNPDDPLALAYFVYKKNMLFGRYWGTNFDIPFLHFNLCYYAGIEWAINHNIQIFDPGAGGAHKPRRGFPATPVYSLHHFYDWRMQFLLLKHIDKINSLEQQEIDLLNANLPFSV